MKLTKILSSKRSHTGKSFYCTILFMCSSETDWPLVLEFKNVVTLGRRGRATAKGHKGGVRLLVMLFLGLGSGNVNVFHLWKYIKLYTYDLWLFNKGCLIKSSKSDCYQSLKKKEKWSFDRSPLMGTSQFLTLFPCLKPPSLPSLATLHQIDVSQPHSFFSTKPWNTITHSLTLPRAGVPILDPRTTS